MVLTEYSLLKNRYSSGTVIAMGRMGSTGTYSRTVLGITSSIGAGPGWDSRCANNHRDRI